VLAEGASAVDPSSTVPSTLTNQFSLANEVSSTFTTTRPGRLLLVKSLAGYLACSATSWWWLTLDGVPVRESVQLNPQATTFVPMTLNGVTSQAVAAGAHSLGVGAMCFSGSSGGAGVITHSGGSVIVLG
jgi:hypothetical protein